MDTKPIIAIVGQTATGKSQMAIEVAEEYGGEIICADSRTIYKGMDIGTAKPSPEDRAKVPHHGLDLVTPDKTFSAYDFQQYARGKIAEIHSRGMIPFVVGGTGLYIDGFLYDYSFGPAADPIVRAELEQKSLHDLQQMAYKIGIDASDVSFQNRRHLSRAIERGKIVLQKKQLPKGATVYAIQLDKDTIDERISARIDDMVGQGLVDEVSGLMVEYGPRAPGLAAPLYNEIRDYILGECTLAQALEQSKHSHRQLAKRQLTWFKRNPDILWVQSVSELKNDLAPILTKI